VELTPYITVITAMVSTHQPIQTTSLDETPTATVIPTPFIHTVALGETISSLALRYGVEMAAIREANPDVDPNAMTVGMELVIPFSAEEPIGGIALEPLPLVLSEPACRETVEDGLWCLAEVENPLERAAVNITAVFELHDASGEILQRLTVPSLLNRIHPGERIPLAAYFAKKPANTFTISAKLVTAQPVDGFGYTFLPVEITQKQVVIEGKMAVVSGEVTVEVSEEARSAVWVAAVAFDRVGNLIGVRRAELELAEGADGKINFSLFVYSFGPDIAEVRVIAEAFQLIQ